MATSEPVFTVTDGISRSEINLEQTGLSQTDCVTHLEYCVLR